MPFTVLERLLRPIVSGPATKRYPARPLELPALARGLPEVDITRCDANGACVGACPSDAIEVTREAFRLDAGRCVLCAACVDACPTDALTMGTRVELAARSRGALIVVSRRS